MRQHSSHTHAITRVICKVVGEGAAKASILTEIGVSLKTKKGRHRQPLVAKNTYFSCLEVLHK